MKPSRVYRWIIGMFRVVLWAFFREVEVVGAENVPEDGGGILVAWHPNGMVDPGLIMTSFPRQVIFGARHGSFRVPVLGWMMRLIGTVPIYRAKDTAGMDPLARREANLRSLDALARRVADGSFSCLFPEGESHDAPNLLDLKSGAARFYYQARQLTPEGAPPPVIIPVGLHYDAKREFRSKALVQFHPPMELDEVLDVTPTADEPEEACSLRARALTAEIERVLDDVVGATETWDLHYLMHRTRKLLRAERACRAGAAPKQPRMFEKTLGFSRVRAAHDALLKTHPQRVAQLRERIEKYDKFLEILRIEDHELDRVPRQASPWQAALLVGQVVAVYLLMPPLLVIGYLVNLPVAIGLLILSKMFATKRKDEATIKVMFGAVAFPLTWTAVGVLVGYGHHQVHRFWPSMPDKPVLAGLLVVLLGALGGMLALRYLRLVRETARAVRVRLTRRRRKRALLWLLRERAELCDALVAFSQGLELPGTVLEDGRIEAEV